MMPDHTTSLPDPYGATRARSELTINDIEVRPLRTNAEYRACVTLQKATWGAEFGELVPLALLKVGQRIGGVTAGAFNGGGRMLGFVFGLTGIGEGGRLVHWSDMLAVRKEARNLGIGRRLKEFQRDSIRARGVETIYWTFDPLVSRNAHLNLNRLGAQVIEYIPDMYGDSESHLHRGLGTDRFVVAWRIANPDGRPPVNPVTVRHTPVVNSAMGDGGRLAGNGVPLDSAPVVRVQVPADIQTIQVASLETAALWRTSTREAFLKLFERGYRVTGFYRDDREGSCYYVLSGTNSLVGEE